MTRNIDLYVDNSLVGNYDGETLFDDIYIESNSLPEIDFDEIDTKTSFMGKEISFPLIIPSITGGTEKGLEINDILITVAKELNLPIALGSQEENNDEEYKHLFLESIDDDIVNEVMMLSNFSARASLDFIESTMREMNSSGFCVHLNSAQVSVSYDLEKKFSGITDNIKLFASKYSDNMIVKEKGMGMSKNTIQTLVDCGVKYIDVSGHGGTNFIELENLRNYRKDFSELYGFGIPTAKSILNAKSVEGDFKIIASGGIKNGLDIAKALILGADYVSVAGELVKYLLHGGFDQAKYFLEDIIYKTKVVMLLLGVKNIEELKKVDYKIIGKLKEIVDEESRR